MAKTVAEQGGEPARTRTGDLLIKSPPARARNQRDRRQNIQRAGGLGQGVAPAPQNRRRASADLTERLVRIDVVATEGDIERFWAKVDRGGPDDCWPWTGGASDAGYGRFKIQGRLVSAHRIAYQLAKGPIPHAGGWHGPIVRHTCDFPRCCNPDHLVVGTQSENMADMVARKRAGRAAKDRLTEADARAIIRDRRTCAAIAADYGVTPGHIAKIRRGECWGRARRDRRRKSHA